MIVKISHRFCGLDGSVCQNWDLDADSRGPEATSLATMLHGSS